MPSIISLLVWLLIFAIVAGVGYYIISLVPPPIQRVAYAIFYVILAIILIYFLLQFAGGMTFPIRR